jgi:hypothetical protein
MIFKDHGLKVYYMNSENTTKNFIKSLDFTTTGQSSIRQQTIKLSLKTSCAYVKFAANLDGSGSYFLIALVASSNATVKLYENSTLEFSNPVANTLSATNFRDFIISWRNGMIYVNQEIPIVFYKLKNPFDVKSINVSTA